MTRFDISLQPSLSTIEDRLRGPSTQLVQRWIDNPRSLPTETLGDLERNPLAQELREVMSQPEPAPSGEDNRPVPPMSAALQELIQRRDAARQHRFSEKPRAGQIMAIDQVIGPDGPLDHDLPSSLAVCLDHPTETPAVWYGWLVSAEVDYASYWDLVLEESDGPCDPQAGMIQLWNPVRIYLPSTGPVLAELSNARLAALRSLAIDYVMGQDPDPAQANPGRMLPRRTDAGLTIMTGTPMQGDDDPRYRYQDLYQSAAEVIKVPARLAMATAATGTPSPLAGLLDWFHERWMEAARQAGLVLLPVAAVEQPLGPVSATEQICFKLGDTGLRLEIEASLERNDVVYTLRCHNTGDQRWSVEILEAHEDGTEHPAVATFTVNPGQQVERFVPGDVPHTLRLSHEGQTSYRLPLPAPPQHP